MANTGKHIFYNASLVVNGVDLSARVEKVEIALKLNKHPGAAMGDLQDYSMAGTKVVEDVKVTFFNDYNTAQVYQTLYAAWAARTTFNITGKPDSGANDPTNPAITVPVFVGAMPFMTGARGDRAMADVELTVAGVATFATS